jgi:hypothetical protein
MSTLRWTIILTGGALVAVLGLWTNETRLSLATDPREGVIESPPVASEVAPSQVIDPNPTFFFGAGDGSNPSFSPAGQT